MSAISLRKGWCPGALRPMLTGDGLLVRIRVPIGRLALDSAEAIADCSARLGNGVIEISSRANLQLRGVGDSGLQGLQRQLDELGLLDADEAQESARNIVASPLSDIDPAAVLDVAPIEARLAQRLQSDGERSLPPKFSFLVDGGGVLPLGDVEADVRFAAFHDKGVARFAVTLAGVDDLAAPCAPDDVPIVAAALADVFLTQAEPGLRRMKELVALRGAAAIFSAAGLTPFAPSATLRPRASRRDFLGVHAFGSFHCVGVAPSLGRMMAEDFRLLAQEARRRAAADIRLTPWRTLIVTGLGRAEAQTLAAFLEGCGFILDPADPRLAIVACSGTPACANATRPVQTDALKFASAIAAAQGIALHVSGCEKGCAHAKVAPLTLIAREGAYDLVVDGKASDKPSRFALSVGEAASLLAREYGVLSG
jgi:precorrin-3B synthase